MKQLKVKLTIVVLLLVQVLTAWAAGKPVFEVSTPLTVAVGEAFRVEFALNAKPDEDSFRAPQFEGFDVLAGPAVSTGSSIQIINGTMSKSVNCTYTFVLLPKSAGNYTIGVAEVVVDGETVRSNPQPIEVVDEVPCSRPKARRRNATSSASRIARRHKAVWPRMMCCCVPWCRSSRSIRTSRCM